MRQQQQQQQQNSVTAKTLHMICGQRGATAREAGMREKKQRRKQHTSFVDKNEFPTIFAARFFAFPSGRIDSLFYFFIMFSQCFTVGD